MVGATVVHVGSANRAVVGFLATLAAEFTALAKQLE